MAEASGGVGILLWMLPDNLKQMYYIYILTNASNQVLYTGVTHDLGRRLFEHQNKLADGFTKKYNLNKLVFYDDCEKREAAIAREKELKGLLKQKKMALISERNPAWNDLSGELG
jgi:putative endonuclease